MTTLGLWFIVALYVLANVPINTHKDLHKPGKRPVLVAKKVRDVIGPSGDRNSMRLASDSRLRNYTYIFQGRASYRGQPCANASVKVRLITSREVFIKGGFTDEVGNYSVEMNVVGSRYEPVDWSMEAFTPDFEKVTLDGRRIVMREDENQDIITVHNAVDFVTTPKLPS